MEVIAVATPGLPDWGWRIVNRAGEIIAESRQVYPSIAAAITKGAKRLKAMNAVDRSERPVRTWWRAPLRRTS